VEGPQVVVSASASDVVKAQVKLLLQSPNLQARVKALKLAKHVATPDMSGVIVGAALIDSGIKESVINSIQESEAYRRAEDSAVQAKRTSNPSSDIRLTDSERGIIIAGVLKSIIEPLNKQTAELVAELYAKDPAAAVDGLAAVYHRQQKLIGTNGQRITEHDAVKYSCDLIDAALLSGGQKEPCLLMLADRLIEDSAFEEAASFIGKIGLPEGAERLGALAQKAGDQLARTTRLGCVFLSACAVIGTPECLPLLDAVASNPALHELMAETTAKILNIDLA
jgi:Arc/MetJ-type ribon-helix-helix transcriptional regulator